MARKNVLILTSAAFPPRLDGIINYARSHDWNIFCDRLLDRPISFVCDGALVLLSNDARELRIVRSLLRRKIPVVDLSLLRSDIRLPRVTGDNLAIGRIAAEHFNEHGYTHAAWFSGAWSPVHRLRLQGFGATFKGKIEQWVWNRQGRRKHSRSIREFSRWLEQTLQIAPKPIAVFCYDDADAACVLATSLKLGIDVPNDIAILGVDDDRSICEHQSVSLSSVQHDQIGLAHTASELLNRLMRHERPPRRPILIPPLGITSRISTDAIAATNPRLRKALTFLRDNSHQPIGISQVADHLGISPTSVKRLFASELKTGIPAILSRIRLSKVKALLQERKIKLSEIARRCGYCNASYLSNSFKGAFGLTPSQWRKRRNRT